MPYIVPIPLLTTEGLDQVEKEQDVAFALPSLLVHEIVKRGKKVAWPCLFSEGEDTIISFWQGEDPSFVDRLGGLESLRFTLPGKLLKLLLHTSPKWHGHHLHCKFIRLRFLLQNLLCKICSWNRKTLQTTTTGFCNLKFNINLLILTHHKISTVGKTSPFSNGEDFSKSFAGFLGARLGLASPFASCTG